MYHLFLLQVPLSRTRRWPQRRCILQTRLLISVGSTTNWARAFRVAGARISQRLSSWSHLGQTFHVAHTRTSLILTSRYNRDMPFPSMLGPLEETTLRMKAEPLRGQSVLFWRPFLSSSLTSLGFLSVRVVPTFSPSS